MGPGSVEKTRVIPEKKHLAWYNLIISLPKLLLYVPNDDHWPTSDMFEIFVTAFPDDCCGPIFFRSPPNTVLSLVVNGHQVCLCAFDSSMAIEGIAYDAGISEPVDPLFFSRPQKKGWNMFGHPESLWNCEVNSNIYTFFFVTFFHLLLALGVKNRWVFKISVPTFFCCWTLHLLIVSDTSCGKNHPFPKSYTNSPPKKGRTSVLKPWFLRIDMSDSGGHILQKGWLTQLLTSRSWRWSSDAEIQHPHDLEEKQDSKMNLMKTMIFGLWVLSFCAWNPTPHSSRPFFCVNFVA